MIRAALIAAFGFLALYQPGNADPPPAIHYSPAAKLERIDVALIDAATREIDIAAYVLTDWSAGYFCYLQALATKKTRKRALNFGPSTGGHGPYEA